MPKLFELVKENLFLVVIIFLAAILRFYQIEITPPALNWDEVSHGYNAYSILRTGKDEWGATFPAIFRAYGDYKLPVYIYATAISEFFLGLSALAVRLPSVLAGIATVLFTYLLAKSLFDKKVAFLATLLVAIEPWSFFLSRGAFEANLALAFIVSGAYFFWRGIHNSLFLIPASLLFGLSVWTYNSARIFVPLFLVMLVLLYKKELLLIWRRQRKIFAFCIFLFALFFIPMFWQLFNPAGQARYQWVSILDEGAVSQIDEARNRSTLPGILPRVRHNKATFFASRFVQNYFSHFSGEFLFLKGGTHFQFSVPEHGLIYLVNLPFFLIGLLWLARNLNRRTSWLLLAWLLLAPIPDSLTREAPHVLRSIVILPIPMVLSGLGAVKVWGWLKPENLRILGVSAYVMLLFIFSQNYLLNYFGDFRRDYSWSWQYGYLQAVNFAKENYDKYDQIIISKKYGEPHEFFLFYWPWEPQKYGQDTNLIRFFQSNWYWVDRFDKFYFVNDWEIPKEGGGWKLESGSTISLDGKTLLITSPGNYPSGWKLLETINFLDGKPAFEILEKT